MEMIVIELPQNISLWSATMLVGMATTYQAHCLRRLIGDLRRCAPCHSLTGTPSDSR